MSDDPYCYPDSNVLRNKFDIHDEEELKATEARVAAIAMIVLEDEPLQGPMNQDRFKATHRAIFNELYDWAGSYRENVGTMTKGRDVGYKVTYGNSQFVPGEMKRIFHELAAEDYLQGCDPDRFAARITYFYSELDATHPFREGNSRTLRQFSADLALAAGYELDWEPSGLTEDSRNALYTARDLAFTQRKYAPLLNIIQANLRRLQP
jgi:cell filamentation protein